MGQGYLLEENTDTWWFLLSMGFSRICSEVCASRVPFRWRIGGAAPGFSHLHLPLIPRRLPWPLCTAGAWHIHSGVLAKSTHREQSPHCQLKAGPALLRRAEAHPTQEAQKILTCSYICMADPAALCPQSICLAVTLRLSHDPCIYISKWSSVNWFKKMTDIMLLNAE